MNSLTSKPYIVNISLAPTQRLAFLDGNVDSAIFCAGMGMGLVHDVVPVKVLLDRMVKEAEETVNSLKMAF